MRFILPILLSLALAGCGPKTESGTPPATVSSTVLQAAICPTSPPNCFQHNQAYSGIDIEIFQLFCKNRGSTLETTAYDWAGMLGAVIAKRADVAFSGISITEKRKEVMDFSDAYMINTLVIASMASRGITMKTTADWKQYRLAFVRGMYFADLIKTTYKDAYDYSALRQYPSYNELLADLGNGNVDGAFMDSLVLADQKEKGIYDLATSFTLPEDDKFGFAFPKDSPLRDEFNQFLRSHPDEIREIIDRYMMK